MNPIFCAIDTPTVEGAQKLVSAIKDSVGGIKLGLEFFMANGAAGYRALALGNLPVFLDVKLHDIPNTVAGAVTSLLPLQPAFITVHASGGGEMISAAAQAAAKAGPVRPKILAVTVLTSLDQGDLSAVGQDANTTQQVLRLAKLARDNGADGCICSPEEITALRAAVGGEFVLMVPGIRPAWAATNDQKRTLTPREAKDAGATYLVIGRPITKAPDPADAARRIASEVCS